MKKRLQFTVGASGRGVRLTVREGARRHGDMTFSLSYMDAAETLFDLKDFLRASPTGRDCLDQIAANRRRAEVARLAT